MKEKIFNIISRRAIFLGVIGTSFIIGGCGTGTRVVEPNRRSDVKVLRVEKRLRNFSRMGYLSAEPVTFPSKKGDKSEAFTALWQGALKTLAGLPLEVVDPARGFLQTQWVIDAENAQHRFQVQVIVYPSQELRVEAVTVQLVHQILRNGTWMLTRSSQSGAQSIKQEILLNARANLAIDRDKALEPE